MKAKLTLVENQTGDTAVPKEIVLSDSCPTTIGRGINSTIVLSSLQISRRHCSLEYSPPNYLLRDLSTNGITINACKLTKNVPIVLSPSALIQLVPTGTLIYRFDPVTTEINDSVELLSLPGSPPQLKRKRIKEEKNSPKKQKINDLSLEQLRSRVQEQEAKIEQLEASNEVLEFQKEVLQVEFQGKKEQEVNDRVDKIRGDFVHRFNDILEAEFGCCICSGVFVEPSTSPTCGHTYCTHCISEWLKKKQECPICRAPINTPPRRHVEMDNFITRVYDLVGGDLLNRRVGLLQDRKTEVEVARQQPLQSARVHINPFELFVELQQGMRGSRRGGRGRRGRGQNLNHQQGLPGGGHQQFVFPPGMNNRAQLFSTLFNNAYSQDVLMID